MNIKKITLFLLFLTSPSLLFAARPSIIGLQVELNQLKESVSGLEHNGAIYRWAQWSTYEQGRGWFGENDPLKFGGVSPSTWTDGNANASQMSADKDVLQTLFTRKGFAGKNATVVADEYAMYSSTNGKMVATLFRIKNTTANTIVWNVRSHHTAYSGWGERASIAVNGNSVWVSTGSNYAANDAVNSAIQIPPNQTSTVIFVSASAPPLSIGSIQLRANFLAFSNNSLELPVGLEYVDDLDTATGGWEQ